MNCKNCKGAVHVPDEKTGLIHSDNRYACYTVVKNTEGKGKEVRLDTVAEA